jgi:hypothetical protein
LSDRVAGGTNRVPFMSPHRRLVIGADSAGQSSTIQERSTSRTPANASP